MEKRYYTSTNWGPWLGGGFLLSTIFFGLVSSGWLLLLLVIFSFLPALVVSLTLRGYFLIENNQIKYCYDRKSGRETVFAISIVDVTHLQRVNKSVAIFYGNDEVVTKRLHEGKVFVNDIMERNARIEYVIA